jgi:hypothetical protein
MNPSLYTAFIDPALRLLPSLDSRRDSLAFCADMEGWKRKADHIFIWHYNTNFRGYELPFPNLRSIGRSVSFFGKNHGKGVFMQAAGNGFSTEMSDLRNYVMARCLWKPGRDSWKETEEFCRLHYAESAGPILACLKYYHDLVGKAGVHPTCFPTEASLCIHPESARQMMDYFQKALALAKSDTVRARVEKASICAYRAALSASSMELVYRDGICRPDLAGFDPDLLDRYTTLCARFGVTMEGETIPTGHYIAGVRKLHEGLKAVRLENEFWRVVFLPGSNAKVVEMTYKPTGRNVIHPVRSFDRFRHEEWAREGDGPTSENIATYESKAETDRALLSLTLKEGTRIERRISLKGDAVRFETSMTAGQPRNFSFRMHPEYDTGSMSDDPDVLGIYVKEPGWTRANRDWRGAVPTDAQKALIQNAAAGGAFAYYNHRAKFGVEQRFDPREFSGVELFWSPSRQQINLEMLSKVVPLAKGQEAHYAWEVRYLAKLPATR